MTHAIDTLLERALLRVEAAERDHGGARSEAFERAVAESVAYLQSEAALRDLERDPYWPKWVAPWWHMLLLVELGLASRIPAGIAARMAEQLDRHFVHDFPFRIEDLPPGKNPFRHVVCHCALGSIVRVLHACGVDVLARLPWVRDWFPRYQLPDGGLNCDEQAYQRPVPRSSMVSTLPAAEAVLLCSPEPAYEREQRFLAGAASYLLERSLVRSRSRGGALIDATWLEPAFPRFYFYDVLRGLHFLARYAERSGKSLPFPQISPALDALESWFARPAGEREPREPHRGQWTLWPDASGAWQRNPHAPSFSLLDMVGPSQAGLRVLEREWLETLRLLARPGALA